MILGGYADIEMADGIGLKLLIIRIKFNQRGDTSIPRISLANCSLSLVEDQISQISS